ncbi:hypothetical protein AgCh_012651 [Apium graveolens]
MNKQEAKKKTRELKRLAREKEAEKRRKQREKEVESRRRKSVSGEAVKGERVGFKVHCTIIDMEEREVELDIESVLGAGRVPPADIVAEGRLDILSNYITELCCLMMSEQ